MTKTKLPLVVVDGPDDEDWIKAVTRRRDARRSVDGVASAWADAATAAIAKDKGWAPGPNAGWRKLDEEPTEGGPWTDVEYTTNSGRKTKMGKVRQGQAIDAKAFHESVLKDHEGIVPIVYDVATDTLNFPNAGRFDADHGNLTGLVHGDAVNPDLAGVRGNLYLPDGQIEWYDMTSEADTIAEYAGAHPKRVENRIKANLRQATRALFYVKKPNGRTVKAQHGVTDIREILGWDVDKRLYVLKAGKWAPGPNAGWRRVDQAPAKLTTANVDAKLGEVRARWAAEDEERLKQAGDQRPDIPAREGWWKEVEPEPDGTLYPMAVSDEARGGYADAERFAAPGQTKRVWMAPGEYLRVVDEMFSKQYGERVSSDRILHDAEGLETLRQRIRGGEALTIPWLDYDAGDAKLNGQEGRHRALAAMLEGVKSMPVDIVLRHGEQWADRPEAMNELRTRYGVVLQEEPKETLRKRLLAILKDKGWAPGDNAMWRRKDGTVDKPWVPGSPDPDTDGERSADSTPAAKEPQGPAWGDVDSPLHKAARLWQRGDTANARDAFGRPTVPDWTITVDGMQEASEWILYGRGKYAGGYLPEAQAIHEGIRASGPAPELFRGIVVDDPGMFKVGSEHNFSIQSFSADRKWAADWAENKAGIGDGYPVLFKLKAGATALDLQPSAKDTAYEWAQEYLTAGKFRITGKTSYRAASEAWDDAVLVVEIEQVGKP